MVSRLNLIEKNGIKGYYLDDIKEYLGGKDSAHYKEFMDWYTGQIGYLDGDKLIVYQYDFEVWMNGRGGLYQ